MKTILCLLLVLLPVVGFVNYRRNAPLDEELQNRIHANLSDADLLTLIEAYRLETKRLAASVTEAPGGEDELDGIAPGDFDGKVKAFQNFQVYNRQWRRSRAELFEQEAALEELRREQSIRERGLDKPANRILRRVVSF
jgi:hypothetical protein